MAKGHPRAPVPVATPTPNYVVGPNLPVVCNHDKGFVSFLLDDRGVIIDAPRHIAKAWVDTRVNMRDLLESFEAISTSGVSSPLLWDTERCALAINNPPDIVIDAPHDHPTKFEYWQPSPDGAGGGVPMTLTYGPTMIMTTRRLHLWDPFVTVHKHRIYLGGLHLDLQQALAIPGE